MLSRAENALGVHKENAAPLSRQAAALKKNAAGGVVAAGKPLGLAATKAAAAHHAPASKTGALGRSLVAVQGNKENAENELPAGKAGVTATAPAAAAAKKGTVVVRSKKPAASAAEPSGRVTRSRTAKGSLAAVGARHPAVGVADENTAPPSDKAAANEVRNLKKRNAAKEPKYANDGPQVQQHALKEAPAKSRAHAEPSKAAPAENAAELQQQQQQQLAGDHVGDHLSARSKRIKLQQEISVPIPDIDEEDEEDPAMCAVYAKEIMDYLMDREKFFMPSPTYITQHPELKWNMRTILVDWLVEVHQKFRFLPETLFLAVNIMDRFLSRRVCSLNKFQLVGLASLFIAAKTEEVVCPPVQQFSFMADNAFTDDDMLRAEQYILRVLDFNIWAPGPFSFLRRISKVDDYNVNHRTLAKYFAEISLLDQRFLGVPPSLVAAASMWLARKLHGEEGWDDLFTYISGYTEDELKHTVELIVDWLCKPPEPESFFYRKYSARRYGRASQAAYNWARETQLAASWSQRNGAGNDNQENCENEPGL